MPTSKASTMAGHLDEGLRRIAGFQMSTLFRHVAGIPRFVNDARRYKTLHEPGTGFALAFRHLQPELKDRSEEAGDTGGQYFHMDLHVARLIHRRNPQSHIDVGSRLDGFVAHLLVSRAVTVFDIRPLSSDIEGLTFVQHDACDLSRIPSQSVDSLSSLHAVEHLGLGRYGDTVDPKAPLRALSEFQRVLAPGGRLYLALPVGRERLMFNAHRIFAPEQLPSILNELQLVSFASIDDAGTYVRESHPDDLANESYSCGIYEFTRPPI